MEVTAESDVPSSAASFACETTETKLFGLDQKEEQKFRITFKFDGAVGLPTEGEVQQYIDHHALPRPLLIMEDGCPAAVAAARPLISHLAASAGGRCASNWW